MQNNLGKTLTYSALVTDFAMGGPDEGDGIINLGAMIDGGTNFKLMYNILERLGVNDTAAVSSISYDAEIGDPMFAYNNLASYRLVINSNSTVLDHNMAIDSTNLLRSAPTANNNSLTPTPVLTPLFCKGSELIKRWEIEDAIYYFIPSTTTTSSTVWIGLGVKSNCWSQDNLDRWIIGRRVSINKSYNYIFKAVKKESQNIISAPNYVWTYYRYSNSGSYVSTTTVEMNNYTFDGFYNGVSGTGFAVTKDSVYNRLSGNFYDILRGLKTYDWDVNNANRHCTCFSCPCRNNGGTGTTSGATNLHAAPHLYLNGTSTSGWWQGTNRPFNLYRHIVNLDMSKIYTTLGLTMNNLILYPGVIESSSPGTSTAYLTSGAILDLNKNMGTTSSAIATINLYNRYISKQLPPLSQSGGRIMYIIPSYTLSFGMNVYINTPKSTTPYWNCPSGGIPTSFISTLGNLSAGNSYIIECWTDEIGESNIGGVPKKTYAKMYSYSTLTGVCNNVSKTISCMYINIQI